MHIYIEQMVTLMKAKLPMKTGKIHGLSAESQ